MNEVREVYVSTIPHGQQRYDTVGDWWYHPEDGGSIEILTSDLGDWRMSMCCAVHELVETLLCVNDGVAEALVSRFDSLYEALRQHVLKPPTGVHHAEAGWKNKLYVEFGCDCIPTEDSEPGEDRHAPYRKQHAFADGIERLLANQLGVVWDRYAEVVTNLDYEAEKETFRASSQENSQ